jgi:hypothetical protein
MLPLIVTSQLFLGYFSPLMSGPPAFPDATSPATQPHDRDGELALRFHATLLVVSSEIKGLEKP